MDVVSLLALRLCARDLYDVVRATFTVDRMRIARRYVNDPQALWDILRHARASIGGPAALAFILRDPDLFPDVLDIYVNLEYGQQLEDSLLQRQALGLTFETAVEVGDDLANDVALPPNEMRSTTLRTPNGRRLIIHISTSASSIEHLVASWTSAFVNYVSADVVACAYPTLTLRRRALALPVHELRLLQERDAHAWLLKKGFMLARYPDAWPEYPATCKPTYDPFLWKHRCYHDLYICPDQARFFGDAGSLLALFDPLEADVEHLRQHHALPFGVVAVWRLYTGLKTCHGRCFKSDPLLLPNYYTHPAVLIGRSIRLRCTFPLQHIIYDEYVSA
ncbi:hypothetical protein OH77DRAFT_1395591 [Trametes cingulata]|nr:hypothetical protein OH77DRAFT_1395591 [Trametes cingulata]